MRTYAINDIETAENIARLNWPDIEPYIGSMIWSCLDEHYPTAQIFASRCIALGAKALPPIRDQMEEWLSLGAFAELRSLLSLVIEQMVTGDLALLEDQLLEIARLDCSSESEEDCSICAVKARRLLTRIHCQNTNISSIECNGRQQ